MKPRELLDILSVTERLKDASFFHNNGTTREV